MLPMATTSKAAALCDEVQGACDASRVQRALEALASGEAAGLVLDGWTPLQFACENRRVADEARAATIHALVGAGVNVNAADEEGWTALHLLCKNKHVEEIGASLQQLLTSGANVNAATNTEKKTALHLICETELATASTITLLLKAHANAGAVDSDGNTALHVLAENGGVTTDALVALINAHPRAVNTANQFQSTPFHNLCQNGRVAPTLVDVFLQHDADPNAANNIGNTPFHFVCENYALTLELLQRFTAHKRVNVTLANSLGHTALELIPPHQRTCVTHAAKFAAPSASSGTTRSNNNNNNKNHSQDPSNGAAAGGEDASELPSALAATLTAWNASLPPFDAGFYLAICCEPAFVETYEALQDVSLQLASASDGGDAVLFQAWTASLRAWRGRVLLAYAALVPPSLWDDYAVKHHRVIPTDLAVVRRDVEQLWTKLPEPTQRRDRLSALDHVFPA